MIYRVVSERLGLVWTGSNAKEANEIALMVCINTGRTVYLQEGEMK